MDDDDWNKIRQNYVKLIENLQAEALLPSLFQDEIIDLDDMERVQFTGFTSEKKAATLLRTLKFKEWSYEPFHKALYKTQRCLAELIGPPMTPVLAADSRSVQETPEEFLKLNFTECQGYKTSFAEVKSLLNGASYQRVWTVPELEKLVCQIFKSVEITKDKVKKKRLEHIYFNNLRKETNTVNSEPVPENSTGITSQGNTVSQLPDIPSRAISQDVTVMDSWGTDELCLRIQPLLEKHDIDQSVLKVLRKEQIDGVVFRKLTTEDMKELFPDLPFGPRKKLDIMKQELADYQPEKNKSPVPGDNIAEVSRGQECEVPTNTYESLQKFDSVMKSTGSYKRHNLIRGKETKVTNMIEPVHKFVPAQNFSGADLLRLIGDFTIQFAAACLNSRTNGTIHFGISDAEQEQQKYGEILGVDVEKETCESAIDEVLHRDFFRDQFDVAKFCIRPARLVEVVQAQAGAQLHVVEVDVVPLASLTSDDIFFLRVGSTKDSKQSRKTKLFWYDQGDIAEVVTGKIPEFMKLKDTLTKTRMFREEQHLAQSKTLHTPDLRDKFLNLFCGPSKALDNDCYPVLICGKPDHLSRQVITKESFEFIKKIDWTVVMDMDDAENETGLYNLFEGSQEKTTNTLTADDFDPRHSQNLEDKDRLTKLHDELCSSVIPPWVFVNGYAPLKKDPLSPKEWKTKRSEGFKEALRFFHSEIPEYRAIIVILLLSKEQGIMVEIADEICTKFPDQWMIVAEEDTMAEALKSELIRRNIDKDILEDRCLVGIPWKHVSVIINQLQGPTADSQCLLPTSTGAPCNLKEKVQNILTDIEILSLCQCEGTEIEQNPEKFDQLQRDEEERFYKGDEVSWWNFRFKDHVCQRKEHGELLKQVQRSLEGEINENDKVGRVHLYHQPGAGGTTTSRNILWELRKEYRCCILREISDQTCDQIAKFRSYEDPENPKPFLILVDNMEDEKMDQLYGDLEEAARQAVRRHESDRPFTVYGILLICYRRTQAPREYEKKRVILKHELQPEEIQWFKKKYLILEKKHREKKGVDPTSLISFNILKANFDQDYIRRTVTEFLNDIRDARERDLLKYVSLINSFDIDFQLIPLTVFDSLMQGTERGVTRGTARWETRLTASIRVLLNQKTSRRIWGKVQGLRVFNTLLSKEILGLLLAKGCIDAASQSTGECMLEFLHSPIFRKTDNSIKHLIKIVKNLIKKRAWIKPGRIKKFSPLITEIVEKEDIDRAAEVMDTVFEKTDDPMIAQQISRLYIHAQNWKKAEEFAKIATNMRPNNSFVWDTYGQVYKQQVQSLYNKSVASFKGASRPLDDEVVQTIDAALRAIEIFGKEQDVSKHEKNMQAPNTAGYFGEVQVVILTLDLLRFVDIFEKKETLHRFLVDPNFRPAAVESRLGTERIDHLKSFYRDSYHALSYLEDEFLQLKDVTADDYRRPLRNMNKDSLIKLKENHDNYFGEGTNEVPKNMKLAEAAAFKRRRVIRLCGISLGKILDVRDQPDGEINLITSQKMLLENIQTECGQPQDYKVILAISLTLSVMRSGKSNCTIRQLIDWSKKLVDVAEKDESVILEAYLYFVMLHWPTGEPLDANRCSYGRLQTAMKEWNAAFHKRFPRQREERPVKKKETTIFHLGKGQGLQKYAHFEELHGRQGGRAQIGDQIWRRPDTARRLQALTGTLTNRGNDVHIELKSPTGNVSILTIPCGLPIQEKSLWNKKVFFFLGFSSSGPKAFGVTGDDPNIVQFPPPVTAPPRPMPRPPPQMEFTVDPLMHAQTALDQIEQLKAKQKCGRRLTSDERCRLKDERMLVVQRDELLFYRNELFAEHQMPYFFH